MSMPNTTLKKAVSFAAPIIVFILILLFGPFRTVHADSSYTVTVTFIANDVVVASYDIEGGQGLTSIPDVPIVHSHIGKWRSNDFSKFTRDTVIMADYLELLTVGQLITNIPPETSIIDVANALGADVEGLNDTIAATGDTLHINGEEYFTVVTGDVDGLSGINANDASTLLRSIVKMISLNQQQILAADTTGDGNVSAGDASAILRYVVRLQTTLGKLMNDSGNADPDEGDIGSIASFSWNIGKLNRNDVRAYCVRDNQTYSLHIFGKGDMMDFGQGNESGAPWSHYIYPESSIITIADGITSIGSNAFYFQANLKSITLPDNITHIGDYAFAGCYALTSINIPGKVKTLGNNVFTYCESLTSITLPDGVTSLGDSIFFGCYSLESISIPPNVKSIGNQAFAYCESLTAITIPRSVTVIEDWAFRECPQIAEITFEHRPEDPLSLGNKIFLLDETSSRPNVYLNNNLAVTSYRWSDNNRFPNYYGLSGKEGDVVASWQATDTISATVTLDQNKAPTILKINGTGRLYETAEAAPWTAYFGTIKTLYLDNELQGIRNIEFTDLELVRYKGTLETWMNLVRREFYYVEVLPISAYSILNCRAICTEGYGFETYDKGIVIREWETTRFPFATTESTLSELSATPSVEGIIAFGDGFSTFSSLVAGDTDVTFSWFNPMTQQTESSVFHVQDEKITKVGEIAIRYSYYIRPERKVIFEGYVASMPQYMVKNVKEICTADVYPYEGEAFPHKSLIWLNYWNVGNPNSPYYRHIIYHEAAHCYDLSGIMSSSSEWRAIHESEWAAGQGGSHYSVYFESFAEGMARYILDDLDQSRFPQTYDYFEALISSLTS